MRVIKIFLMFGIFIGFMVGGILAASSLAGTGDSASQSGFVPAVKLDSSGAAPNGQRNILLIGVDRLDFAESHLEGLWLLMNVSTSNRVSLLPLYPTTPGNEVLDASELSSGFGLDANGNPDAEFLALIQSADFWWSNYFVLDQAGLAQLIDYHQGVDLGGGQIGGAQAVSSLASANADNLSALNSQAVLIQAVCNQQSGKLITADLRQILTILSGHYKTDMKLKTLVSDWQQPLIASGHVTCEFPTLVRGQGSSTSQ